MTKDEAMRIALEALEKDPAPLNAINNAKCFLYSALEQPSDSVEQKPFAYLYHDTVSAEFANPLADSTLLVLACDRNQNGRNETPLYTAPPKRKWIGLTDEEIKEIIGNWGDTPIKGYTRKLFDQIEAKLKDKNT